MPEEILDILRDLCMIYYLGLYLEPRCHCLIKSAAERAAAILKQHRAMSADPNSIN